jgi:hypothetical protein
MSVMRAHDPNGEELYDLAADPYEIHNLVTDPAHAAEVRQFQGVLRSYFGCKGSACRALEGTFTIVGRPQSTSSLPVPKPEQQAGRIVPSTRRRS